MHLLDTARKKYINNLLILSVFLIVFLILVLAIMLYITTRTIIETHNKMEGEMKEITNRIENINNKFLDSNICKDE